jgi:caa(3)-type oxidase subunit IV
MGALIRNYIFLMILMAMTIGAAYVPHGDSPAWSYGNNAIALGIAITKAILVINIFMGVKYGSNLTKLYAAMGFLWFFTMFFMFADYFTRRFEPIAGWESTPSGALPRTKPGENVEMKGIGESTPYVPR